MSNYGLIKKGIPILCLCVVIVSLFLPFYEGSRTENNISSYMYAIIYTYYEPEVGPIAVYYGFFSSFASINLLQVLILVAGIFFFYKICGLH